MTLAAFIGVALVHLLAAISPGPAFVLSIRTAAREGFAPAAGLALGFGIGAVLWAFAALAGLSLLFQVMPPLFLALKLAGGAFLLWLAWKLWRHAPEPVPAPDTNAAPRSGGRAVRLGMTTQLANPKPAIFFGAVFIGLVPATADWLDRGIVLVNILWVEAAWYIVVARVFSLPRPRAAYARAKAWIDRSMGVVLAGLGLKVALD
ncbi:LysE family translocator [Palleronia sediminis]|uniref:LysE family translocator n=1 Tax=Palleronia sediminis TaxID=2547833 RepID=A0A4R6A7A3_9RHOB|nr:LysE family transporter [Palleronia sediminis]TDL78058.1 LysE family translocator [Palleronia sediminis]